MGIQQIIGIKQIYIAGSFDDSERIDQYSQYLESLGYDSNPHWWKFGDAKKMDLKQEEWLDLPIVIDCFQRDVAGARTCDLFILVFNEHKRLRGALVELGIAFESKQAHPKKIIAIGEGGRSALFRCIDRFYNTFEELVKEERLGT